MFKNSHYKVANCLGLVSATRPDAGIPKKYVGPIATGDKVVANSEFLSEFLKSYPKAIGVEMESGGVASAAFKSSVQPGFFMIRATSDLADNNKDDCATKQWRSYACDLAAAYTIGLLKSGPVTQSEVGSSIRDTNAPLPSAEMTVQSTESQKLVDAKNEILLRALEVHHSVQTVNQIGAWPFFFVARKHGYKDDEEVLLFLEALKQLLSDGYLEGYFERAGKNYPLTYKGLQIANKLKVERQVLPSKPLKRSRPELVRLETPLLIHLQGGEAHLCNQMVRVSVVLPDLIALPVDRDQWSNFGKANHLGDGKTIVYSHLGTGSASGKPINNAVPVTTTMQGQKLVALTVDAADIRDRVVGLAITQEGRFKIENWIRKHDNSIEVDRIIQRYDLSENELSINLSELNIINSLIDGIVFDVFENKSTEKLLKKALDEAGLRFYSVTESGGY